MEKENAIQYAEKDIELLYQGIALLNQLPNMPVTSYYVHPGSISISAEHFDDWSEILLVLEENGWTEYDRFMAGNRIVECLTNGSAITLQVALDKSKVAIHYGSR